MKQPDPVQHVTTYISQRKRVARNVKPTNDLVFSASTEGHAELV